VSDISIIVNTERLWSPTAGGLSFRDRVFHESITLLQSTARRLASLNNSGVLRLSGGCFLWGFSSHRHRKGLPDFKATHNSKKASAAENHRAGWGTYLQSII
jgi:hypothetical protein